MNMENALTSISLFFSSLSIVFMIIHIHAFLYKFALINERRKANVFYFGALAFLCNIISCCFIGQGGFYLWTSVLVWAFMLNLYAHQSILANRLVRAAKGTLGGREKKAFDLLDEEIKAFLILHGQRIIDECGD